MLSDLYNAGTKFEFIMESIAEKPRFIFNKSSKRQNFAQDLYAGRIYVPDFRVLSLLLKAESATINYSQVMSTCSSLVCY